MIKEAEITNQTGTVYLREGSGNDITVNLLSPISFWASTGENARNTSNTQPEISQSLQLYKLLSMTTESKLNGINEISALLALLALALSSNSPVTNYYPIREVKHSPPIKSSTSALDQIQSPDANSASMQAGRLREISGLKVEHLAKIFGISRTTYYKWIEGSPPHNVHREHLFEVLALVEEVNQRLGSSGATSTWLLTPVSPGGKKPIDYLAEREYATFRGFLLRIRTGREVFRPVPYSKRMHIERPQEEFEDALERLRPPVWGDG